MVDVDLNFIINNIIPKLWDNFNLDFGDCGIFAIALNKILNNQGKYIAVVNDYEPEKFYHVALKYGKDYIDGNGKVSKQELLQHGYEDGIRSKPYLIDIEDEYIIKKLTDPTHTVEDIYNEMKQIQNEF